MSSVKYDEVACENVATNLESINSLLSDVSSELERLVGALPTIDKIDNRIIKLSTKTRTNENGTKEDYIDCNTNIGVYLLNGNKDALLFDCGTEIDAPNIYKTLISHNINVKYLVFSHAHADHSSGWEYIYRKPNCKMIASKVERGFFRDPKLDIGFLYGGYPLDE